MSTIRLACEPITEAGAILVPALRYSRGRPVYVVTVNGRPIGEVMFTRRTDWRAVVAGRALSYWVRYPDGALAHRTSWPDRHGAVAAVIVTAAGARLHDIKEISPA